MTISMRVPLSLMVMVLEQYLAALLLCTMTELYHGVGTGMQAYQAGISITPLGILVSIVWMAVFHLLHVCSILTILKTPWTTGEMSVILMVMMQAAIMDVNPCSHTPQDQPRDQDRDANAQPHRLRGAPPCFRVLQECSLGFPLMHLRTDPTQFRIVLLPPRAHPS